MREDRGGRDGGGVRDARGGRELSERGADTRALILDTALDAFAESGYRGTSVREIATRCGLTHPALLYHFPTKADLLMAVLGRRDATDLAGPRIQELHGREILDRLVATARVNATRRGVVELFATLSGEATSPAHPAHRYFVERYEGLREAVERAFRELDATRGLREGIAPEIAARQLIALMDGLQVQWLLDPSVDMVAVLEAHLAQQLV